MVTTVSTEKKGSVVRGFSVLDTGRVYLTPRYDGISPCPVYHTPRTKLLWDISSPFLYGNKECLSYTGLIVEKNWCWHMTELSAISLLLIGFRMAPLKQFWYCQYLREDFAFLAGLFSLLLLNTIAGTWISPRFSCLPSECLSQHQSKNESGLMTGESTMIYTKTFILKIPRSISIFRFPHT